MNINELIKQRAELRLQGRYADADAIRDQLREEGVILEDHRDGTTYWRILRYRRKPAP